jgi:uncharacterized protein YndB with AHSA1/START domain
VERKPSGKAKLTLPSDTEILIEREFKARKASVFDAWCKREWIAQWYGCADQQLTTCETDFREGGEWRWVLRDATSGVDHAFSGRYRSIDRPNRLVFSERYEAIPGSDHTVALTFDERDGVTTLSMRIIHESQANRDGHLKSGMESGIQESFDRIEQLASAAGTEASV